MTESGSNSKVWFITGASKGFGLALVEAALAAGQRVVATSRDAAKLRQHFPQQPAGLLAIDMDLTHEASVQTAVQQAMDTFGRLDVVVNNAGYMLLGSLEEVSAQEIAASMEVNVYGMLHVIRAVLPLLRAQHSGHIINFSSLAGYIGSGHAGGYNAAKFAVTGLSEALAQEVKPFGIQVTVVLPGLFRTNFLDDSAFIVAKQQVEGYQTQQLVATMRQQNGHQPGDPHKLVAALLQLVEEAQPPLHLFMGTDAYQRAAEKRQADAAESEHWKHLTLSANIDA